MSKSLIINLTLAASLSFFTSNILAGEKTSFIAVIEDSQNCNKMGEPKVRVLFKSLGDKWEVVASSDKGLSAAEWRHKNENSKLISIRDDGNSYPNDSLYRRSKLYLLGNQDALNLEKNSDQFTGWCGSPNYKPLVLHNNTLLSNDIKSERVFNTKEYLNKVYPYFRVAVGLKNMRRCPDINVPKTVYYDVTKNEIIVDSVIKINNIHLASLSLNKEKINCDGPRRPEWSKNWFLIDGDNIEFLGNQMQFVDAYDHNDDGDLEYLFWYSGYNEDGYILFYDDFKERSQYLWKYH